MRFRINDVNITKFKYYISFVVSQDKFEFESPLRGSLRLKEPLDYETFPSFNVTIVAQVSGITYSLRQTSDDNVGLL